MTASLRNHSNAALAKPVAAAKKPDPHNLRRFVSKAHEYHQQALSELQAVVLRRAGK